MSFARGAACIAAVALAAACSGAEVSRSPAAASAKPSAAPKAHLPYASPARFEVHPYPPSYATDVMRLAGGGCLVMEYTGQRWITLPRRDKPVEATPSDGEDARDDDQEPDVGDIAFTAPHGCAGEGRAAVDRAPEPLTGIVHWPGAYGFVGESGTVHVARWPIGPFVRRIQPPEPVVRVRSAGGALLAITATGRLLRWEEETGYRKVDLGDAYAIDVAVAPAGRAVVLAAPEALFTTVDGGQHFARADAPSIGAQRLSYAPGGRFVVQGVISSLAWDPRETPAFALSTDQPVEKSLDVSIHVGRTPGAGSVNQGRAAIDGDSYWEANINDVGDWTLFKGRIDGYLSEVPLQDAPSREDTGNLLVSARERHVALGTLRWEDGATELTVRVSHDGGGTFGAGTPMTLGELSPVGMAVSSDGTVLVTGACLAQERDDVVDLDPDRDRSCMGGPILLRPDAPPTPPRSPVLGGPAVAPAFSLDGRSAYFLAGERGDVRTSLYVSHDGGLTFEERSLDIDTDDMRASFGVATETALTVSENGTVGAVLEASGDADGTVWITTDADGKNVHMGTPPEPGATLGGFGERVLAVTRSRSADTTEAPIAESLDGGKTWSDVPAPQTVREGYYRRGDVACSASGCLIGDDVARIGWGAGRDTSVPFERPEDNAPKGGLRTPIVCEPRPGSSWTRLENIANGGFPVEGDAVRGRSAWMLPTSDPETGAIGAVIATIPETPGAESRITTKQLLGPVPKKGRFALAMRPQIEGVSLARMALGPEIPTDPYPSVTGTRIRDLEVAWENLEEGSTGHARIPDAGTLSSYSIYQSPGSRYATLQMTMLSVSPKGMFVRAYGANRATFFAETSGKVRSFTFPEWPPDVLGGGRFTGDDVVNVDGTFIVNADFNGTTPNLPEIVLLMRQPPANAKPDEPWTPWAAMLAPGSDDRNRRFTRTDWTYDGGHLAMWTLHTVQGAAQATAWLRRLQADGTLTPPRRVPTPYDLDKTPRACTAAEHKNLPRLKFPLDRWGSSDFVGVRHAVIFQGDGDASPEPDPVPSNEPDPDDDDSRDPAASAAPAKTAAPKAPAGPAPMGRVSMVSSGLVMRGDGTTACLDAMFARDATSWNRTALIAGDLSWAWFFRFATPKPVKPKSKKKGEPDTPAPAPRPVLEARPVTCHYDPSATVPESVLVWTGGR